MKDIRVPTITVSANDEYFEVETSVSDEVICEDTIKLWETLLTNQSSFCVLSAYLQDLDPTTSIWILDAIKTASGYWITPTLQAQIE